MRNKLITGAGVKCLINNVNIGIVTGISWNEVSQRDEDHGIDALEPFELSPTMVSVQGTVSVYRVRDDGGLEGYNIIKPFPQIAKDQYFTLELKDRHSGATYLKVTHAAVENQNWSVSAKGILMGQFSFRGLSVKNSYRG